MLIRGWCFLSLLSLFFGGGSAAVNWKHDTAPPRLPPSYPTIVVDQSGGGNFTTIQAAIDSVPADNKDWICIFIRAGEYREQVNIPMNKPFIYLKGDGKRRTIVVWGAYGSIVTSPTFTSQADNIIAKSITFRNSYNNPPGYNRITMAVAAFISGDKSAFYRCGFLGFQDTLWDVQGRHYFKLCTIQGAIDFIFGSGQSIYESCTITVNAGILNGFGGYITAQGRSGPDETNGFVFKDCKVIGSGQAYLGRPWRHYARVIFYNTNMSNVVVPEGWEPWHSFDNKHLITFAEHGCYGTGFLPEKRVPWEAKLNEETISEFTSMSYIDNEGWISSQPFNMLNK